MTEQTFVFGIVTVPYGLVPMQDREAVDSILFNGLSATKKRLNVQCASDDWDIGAIELEILDEHGIAEWMAETIEKGLSS